MPSVTLTRREAERGYLPPVCALTGEPTDGVKHKTFLWQPAWIGVLIFAGLLPYVIVAAIMRKRMTVQLPMVRQKHGHWAWRAAIGWLGVVGSVLLLVVAGVMGETDAEGSKGVLVLVGLVGLLGFLVTLAVLNMLAIHPAEITDRNITLVGVHQNFIDALEEERDREEEEYEQEEEERRRKRRSRRDYDDERPRRSSRRDDDDFDD